MLIHSKMAVCIRKIALNRLQSYEKFPTPPSSAASFRRHFSGDKPRAGEAGQSPQLSRPSCTGASSSLKAAKAT